MDLRRRQRSEEFWELRPQCHREHRELLLRCRRAIDRRYAGRDGRTPPIRSPIPPTTPTATRAASGCRLDTRQPYRRGQHFALTTARTTTLRRQRQPVQQIERARTVGRILRYTYDNRNRLTSVTHYTGGASNWTRYTQVKYTYDMFDNLIGRTVTTYGTGGTTTTQRYVFDGTNMVLAFDGNRNLTDRYLWGPAVDQVLADEHFSPVTGEQSTSDGYRHTATRSGRWATTRTRSATWSTDSGSLEQHIAYSPFGQQVTGLTTTGSVVANFAFGYTGTYTDPMTKLQLHGVRWYDPCVGRWLSEDPAAADPNLYRYCGNAPTDGMDPSGLEDSTLASGFSSGLIRGYVALEKDGLWFLSRFAPQNPFIAAADAVVNSPALERPAEEDTYRITGPSRAQKTVDKVVHDLKVLETRDTSVISSCTQGRNLLPTQEEKQAAQSLGKIETNALTLGIPTGVQLYVRGRRTGDYSDLGEWAGETTVNTAAGLGFGGVLDLDAAAGANAVARDVGAGQNAVARDVGAGQNAVARDVGAGQNAVAREVATGEKAVARRPCPGAEAPSTITDPSRLLSPTSISNPWMPGEPIVSLPAPAGTQIDMAMAPGQTVPGGWGTPNIIPNVNYVRGPLGVTPEFKPEIGFVQRFEIPEGVQIQYGTAGPQTYNGVTYPGGVLKSKYLTTLIEPRLSQSVRQCLFTNGG